MNVLLLKQWLSENGPGLIGLRLRNVQQVDTKTLALQLSGKQDSWLVLSIRETYPAMFTQTEAPVSEAVESGFGKALRFHLAGAILVGIEQAGFDRSVSFQFTRKDVYGRETERTLRIELVGRASNAYLLSEKSMVVSIFKHVPAGRNSVRRVVTGKPLPPPPPLGKLIAPEVNPDDFERELAALADHASPIQELMARRIAGGEIALWPFIEPLLPAEPLANQIHAFTLGLQAGEFNAVLFGAAKGQANAAVQRAWSAVLVVRPGSKESKTQTVDQRTVQLAAQLRLSESADELEALALEMLKCRFTEREKEAAYLKGWQLAHSQWAERIDLAKSADENAGTLIEYAQRLKRARPRLQAMLAEASRPKTLGHLAESASQVNSTARLTIDPLQRDLAKLERNGVKFLRFVTSDGVAILVGQSDRSNDELVRHYGSSRHLWLHVRDYPGSHVLLLTNGRDVPQRSLEEAAMVAGYYSQGRGETDLDVSYTPVKQLRRPRGGKPGQVLKLSEKVIQVNPMHFEQLRDKLRVSASAP